MWFRSRYHHLRPRSTHQSPRPPRLPPLSRHHPLPRLLRRLVWRWVDCLCVSCPWWKPYLIRATTEPRVLLLPWVRLFLPLAVSSWACPTLSWPSSAFTLRFCCMPITSSPGSPSSCTCLRRSPATAKASFLVFRTLPCKPASLWSSCADVSRFSTTKPSFSLVFLQDFVASAPCWPRTCSSTLCFRSADPLSTECSPRCRLRLCHLQLQSCPLGTL